jgi:hypothetical protein
MRTGTATAGEVMLVEEPGEDELEHPASRAARVREARARGL